MVLLLSIGVLLLSSCQGRKVRVLRFNEPENPCSEYEDLLLYPDDRVFVLEKIKKVKAKFSMAEELDREACLINWIERYKDLDIWSKLCRKN